MKKIKLKDIELSEEIKKYEKRIGKIDEDIKTGLIAEISYKGFKIILKHNIVPKNKEQFFYIMSKYGWWQYCVKRDKLDKRDEKLLEKPLEYGQYKTGLHSWCNDNMGERNEFHPNKMVEIAKKQIDKFCEDKEKLKNEESN